MKSRILVRRLAVADIAKSNTGTDCHAKRRGAWARAPSAREQTLQARHANAFSYTAPAIHGLLEDIIVCSVR